MLDGKIVVSLHARLDPNKNQIGVVDALSMLKDSDRKQLIVLFSGETCGAYYDQLKSRILELGLTNVFFTGWISAREILSLSDVLILPSFKEGFGLCCIEAFLMKVLVMRTQAAGYEDMKKYCVTINAPTASEIKKTLEYVLYNFEKLKSAYVEKAYQFAIENCTLETMTQRYVKIYKDVLGTDKEKLNIMLFPRILVKTGLGIFVMQLANELANQGHSVTIISGTQYPSGWGGGSNIKFYLLPLTSTKKLQMIKNFFALRKYIKKENIDIVHCHHRVPLVYMRCYNLLWRMRYVYTLHFAPIPNDFYHRIMTFYGDRAIAVSKEAGDFMMEGLNIPRSKISYVLNGVNEKELYPLSESQKEELIRRIGIR